MTFSAAAEDSKSTYPIFSGLKLGNRDDVDMLALSDLGQSGPEALKTTWHLGTRRVPTTSIILSLIKKLKRDNKYENIVVFGSSAGGYAALNISRRVEGSIAVVTNPRTELQTAPTTFTEYLKIAHSGTNPFSTEEMSMSSAYSRRTMNRIVYIQNSEDSNYYENHFIPFSKANLNETKYIVGKWGNGHLVPPEWVYTSVLDVLLKGKAEAEQFFESEYMNHKQLPTNEKISAISKHAIGVAFNKRKDDESIADRLLAGNIVIPGRPDILIVNNNIWDLDPYSDNNWRFSLHSLRWIEPLRRQYLLTNKIDYKSKYREILLSWYKFHIETNRHTPYSWYDMAVGLRIKILVAAMKVLPEDSDWLERFLLRQGEHLSAEKFLSRKGNHALHAMIGLVVCGDYFERQDWLTQAQRKISELFDECVDAQGVDYEGAIQYQLNNFKWYSEAAKHIYLATGENPNFIKKLDAMLEFLAHATNTLGMHVQYGDSDRVNASRSFGNAKLEHAGSRGLRGIPPEESYVSYDSGYTFGRTGWTSLDFEQGIFYSLRHGPAFSSTPHGHYDAGAVTFTKGNRELLFESGRFRYDKSEMSVYLKSAQAHSTVGTPNSTSFKDIDTHCIRSESNDVFDWTVITRDLASAGKWHRSVMHLRELKALLIVDDLSSPTPALLDQYWQLASDSVVEKIDNKIFARVKGSDELLAFSWLVDSESSSYTVATGDRDPLYGWRSIKHGESFPSPVIGFEHRGLSIRTAMLVGTSNGDTFNLEFREQKNPATLSTATEEVPSPWLLTVTLGGSKVNISVPHSRRLEETSPIVSDISVY
ncbi:heparinase II/III family protein [Glutamicibacter arilaitensis]|uniref:heparinase II/III family protein n=1 Tax=Glutamicibacter arilaitensis TaxID=256701 RepID=UPI003FD4CF29